MTERKRTDTSPHYDLEALKRNLESCDKNIAICFANGWNKSLQKELEDKARLLQLIKEIEGQ